MPHCNIILLTLLLGSVSSAMSKCTVQDSPLACPPDAGLGNAPCWDFTGENWTSGFSMALDNMKSQYAFKKWKNINFDAMKAVYLPKVQEAMELKATDSTTAWRNYVSIVMKVFAIPDKHVYLGVFCGLTECAPCGDIGFAKAMRDMSNETYGGSYGFTVAPLDDDTTIVTYVVSGSEAATKGVKAGMVLTDVDGTDIESYAHGLDLMVPTTEPVYPATIETERLAKFRLVPRGPVGGSRTFKFWTGAAMEVTLTAYWETDTIPGLLGPTFQMTGLKNVPWMLDDGNTDLKTHILPSGAGYLGVANIMFNGGLAAAFQDLKSKGAKGLIVDLRGSDGGSDDDAKQFQGMINQDPGADAMFYEYIMWKNGVIMGWCSIPSNVPMVNQFMGEGTCTSTTDADGFYKQNTLISTVNSETQFTGPIVALVNADAVSSSEGVTMTIKKLGPKRGAVVGFTGTSGSFGMAGGIMNLPGGAQVGYPFGYSGNMMHQIQLDRGVNGIGGVQPTHRIPRTADRMIAFVNSPTDVTLEAMDAGTDVEIKYAEEVLMSMMPTTCGAIRTAYRKQGCCGNPTKQWKP